MTRGRPKNADKVTAKKQNEPEPTGGVFPDAPPPEPPAPPPVSVAATPQDAPEIAADSAPIGYMMQPKLDGYRHLSEAEANRINEIKSLARQVRELCADIERLGGDPDDIRVARDHLKIGFSFAVRAVAKPTQW